MSLFPDATAQDRLPAALVTGFLGSGKTTLLNHLLRHPAMANTAIVINEFGDVALDQHFIERSDGEIVVMANGCLCCTVQGDLESVVGTLYAKRGSGAVPAFDRLVIETTGLADPAPIMQLLLSKPLFTDTFALDSVIATVDALHGEQQLRAHREAVNQAALADRIVVTKTDLADAETVAAVERAVAAINPGADLFRMPQAEFPPSRLFGAALVDRERRIRDLDAWLGGNAAAHQHDHLHGIETFALIVDAPVEWRAFAAWLTRIKIRHANELLRVKGIVSIAGETGKIAIHGVHHIFHTPTRLPQRPGDDQASRIVFITSGSVRAAIEAEWRAQGLADHPARA